MKSLVNLAAERIQLFLSLDNQPHAAPTNQPWDTSWNTDLPHIPPSTSSPIYQPLEKARPSSGHNFEN